MSRKRVYNITRFDGGITNELRNTQDLSKCAFVSHFDIYRDPNKLYPMPGYVDDSSDGDDPTGVRQYEPEALFPFTLPGSSTTVSMIMLSKRKDGTGWKIWSKTNPEADNWEEGIYATKQLEGTQTIVPYTYLTSSTPGSYINLYFLTTGSSKTWVTSWDGLNPPTEQDTQMIASAITNSSELRAVAEVAPDGTVYGNKSPGYQDVASLGGTPVASAKNTDLFVMDLQSGNDQLGILGQQNNNTLESRLILWDTGSVLVDQNIKLCAGSGRALGYIDGYWVTASEENLTRSPYTGAGQGSMLVQYVSGGIPYTVARVYAKETTNAQLRPTRSYYRQAMLFEGVLPQDAGATTYKRGIWAVGRATPSSPFALSLLYDSTDLGDIRDFKMHGNYAYFIHGDDRAISRTYDFETGTYDQTAVYESLFFGSDTPYNKTLNGLSVHTEELPSGATVVAKYRFDDDDSWTTMGTASTTGDQIHHFTNASGSQIGTFKEIQFRVEVTGNAPIKDIYISLEEQDSTPYDS